MLTDTRCEHCGQPLPARQYNFGTEDFMPRVGGAKHSFRCQCGCNVFKKDKQESVYKCNGCDTIYEGEE